MHDTSLHYALGTGIDTGIDTGSHDSCCSQSLTGSELRNHFASLEKKAVEASMEEHIKNVETELDELRGEREKMLRELEYEMESAEVDEWWEEGIMAIGDMIR
ncbi:hypothetical protein QBC32DRAFT_383726 [Pseudoneurospora amorphoporcata]|uniref:Uncharacterized protein n=1 Tax=Pseudoneurospora amorphoporcata TaxID=241081 RepID=A0AAN6NKI5_9PEZI|nr:hypothetical protein QBC32DRAFT_383726 [Pseudoneurospora amorphoporcata]